MTTTERPGFRSAFSPRPTFSDADYEAAGMKATAANAVASTYPFLSEARVALGLAA